MEQRKKRGRGFAAITLCCLMAFAGLMGAGTKEVQAAEGEGYSFNDGVLTVTGTASNDLSTVNVTESLVNTIESAIDMSTVTKLVIGDDVTHIDANAFKDCGVTGSLELGDSLVSIGYRGFYGCSGLTGDLVIPDSVTYIGESGFGGAFQNCSGFTSLTISNNLAVIPDYTFKGCTGLTGNIVIPESVTKVGVTTEYWGEAFSGCTGITSVTFGSNVEFIGGGAFKGCTGLAGDLVIPDKVTEIGSNAFENCTGLTGTLTLGSGLTKINSTAFSSCGFTGSLVIPDSVTEISGGNELYGAFASCSGFTSLTLGSGLEKISDSVFWGCSGFKGDLVIPDNVTTIEKKALSCK